VESVADVVEDASVSHSPQAPLNHFEGFALAGAMEIAQEKKVIMWSRKFRSAAETAVFAVEAFFELLIGRVQ
jgi:hypothetical protein